MHYQLPDDLIKFFEKVVNQPYKEHPKTDAWVCEVDNKDSRYHVNSILDRGRADFNTNFNELTPHDRVTIYCYYYMQMHMVSSFHVFSSSNTLFSEYIFSPSKNIVFVDFGCGPLTSGVALAWYYYSLKTMPYDFHYIGIDRCESMLDKARVISTRKAYADCTFDFLTTYQNPEGVFELLDRYVSSLSNKEYLISLNFSYLFASTTLDVENLVSLVRQILTRYSSNKVCLLYQNPPLESLTTRWVNFKQSLPELITVVVEKQANLSYSNTTGKIADSEPTPIKLYFEILLRE